MPQHATPLYFAVMAELERRRLQLGIPMWKLCDGAGASSRYYAKALYPETKSGRQAHWDTLAPFLEALFPGGFEVRIQAKKGACLSADKQRVVIKFSGARYDHEERQDWMAEIRKKAGNKGGIARAKKLSPRRRRAIARKAARKRWSTPKVVEITP